MARYKKFDYSQGKFIPIHFDKQILPGTFKYSLHYLIDNEIDLSLFDTRYRNDEMGAPAYDPAILLKIILYAYSRGITSSRKIAQCCQENIIFMALSAETGVSPPSDEDVPNSVKQIPQHINVPVHFGGPITDLMETVKKINPKIVIPIHTEKPETFKEVHKNVIIPREGKKMQA